MMEFYTAFNKKRPVRLKESTRMFAWESLHGKYGDDAMRHPFIDMDACRDFDDLSDDRKYDAIIMAIAREAPVRLCEDELVSGAATLGGAVGHVLPAIRHGKTVLFGVSHVTLGFDRVLKTGIRGIEHEIDIRLQDQSLSSEQKTVLYGMKNAITAMSVWHKRYLDAARESKPQIYQNLLRVPFETPRNFHEAVQSLWFTFAFTRLCGNWPGLGRIDEMLGPYLKQDLARGILTLDEAREILAGFFIKGCEWIQSNTPAGSGDAQHYQNIVLCGLNAEGREITNEVSYLVLDIVEELPIGDFPITVRMSEQTPHPFKRRIAEVMRHGGGVIAVYNEPLIIRSMINFGYSVHEARRFANDGCWEVQVPGKTYFTYRPFDSLRILLDDTLNLKGKPAHFDHFASLYDKFKHDLQSAVENIYAQTVSQRLSGGTENIWRWLPANPCAVVSLLTDGCIQSGRSYLAGGAEYTVVSPHIGGVVDAGNSLHAINKLVFEDHKVTFDELMQILVDDWDGHETLRQFVLNQYPYYGNDNDEADACTARILDDFADMVSALNKRSPILFPAGVSTFGRQIEWAASRSAVPFGYRKGDILSGNASPTPGTDTAGATAVIRSYCKADLVRQTCGAALDIKLFPTTVQGENGVLSLMALIDGFIALGGFFLQLDVIDAEILKKAQDNPKDYKTLSVRVSGWNARFVTLDKEWQTMIMERNAERLS
ncbi:MAG: pyruvate formate lyase family protein [Clostridiaceae bacterium]|nr:pyruvate formate lyase family protein [Clostridiaceae bacterium]